MTPERWAEVKAVFTEAIAHDASARDAFLTARCGADHDLLEAVGTLLRSHASAAEFMENSPVSGLAADVASLGRWSGEVRGAYQLGRLIAAGGMGEVYESWDTRTGRRVAIKILTDDGVHAARRLKREANHALELDHSGICRVYEVAEDEAGAFIAMEFLEGTVLSDALPASGFDVPTVTALVRQLADAVAHAHANGIVHRDLKSANLMLTPAGALKVLDFGLARRLPPDVESQVSAASLTEAGIVAGTLSYLPPEVLRGERAGTRSDVWAFGIVLHEMLTGRRPFEGRTSFELTSAMLNEEPAPLPSTVPAGLRAIRDNCLAKNPAERYRDGGEVAAALRMLESGVRVTRLAKPRRARRVQVVGVLAALALMAALVWMAIPGRRGSASASTSIAVLPLRDTTAGDPQDYFADGVTEALIGQLGKIGALRVISRASVIRDRDHTRIDDVRRDLNVEFAIRGTVERVPSRVRLTVALIDAATGRVTWQNTFDRGANQVPALEADAVRAIVDRLGVPMSTASETTLRVVRAVDPVVYEAYLKGRFDWNKRTQGSLDQAVAYFKKAIELDPTYAPAHAALADCYNQFGTFLDGTASPVAMRPLARAAAIAAIQADDSLAEAHAALGYVNHYDWEWQVAEREFRRALELNPNLAVARVWYANYLMSRGRFPEAVAEVRRAESLDPFSLDVITNVGWVLSWARQSDEAIVALRRALVLDPRYAQAHMRLGDELSPSGRHFEAIAEHRTAVELTGHSPSSLAKLAKTYARAQWRAEALDLVTGLVKLSESKYVSPVGMYGAFFVLGDLDNGFLWVERALQERSNGIAYLAADPDFSHIRGEPRFQRVLQQVGLTDAR